MTALVVEWSANLIINHEVMDSVPRTFTLEIFISGFGLELGISNFLRTIGRYFIEK